MGLFRRTKDEAKATVGLVHSAEHLVAARNLAAQVAQEQSGSIKAAQEMLSQPGHREAAARLARIMNDGVIASGTIQTVTMDADGVADIVLALTDGPGAPRPLTVRQAIANLAMYPIGQTQKVKLDPTNLDDAMLWTDLPAGDDLRITQLEHLAQMHATGGLPDQTYEMMKARILGTP